MTAAEIQLKMGMTGSSMAQDLRQSKAHLTDFAESVTEFCPCGHGRKKSFTNCFHK